MAEDLFDLEPRGGVEAGSDEVAAIVLRLHVQPGAGRAAVVGRRGDALHVRVAPRPVEGRANAACVELVAELFDVAPARVELLSGARSREKRLRVEGVSPDRARGAIAAALDRAGAGSGPASRHAGRAAH
jgi:uncharacterized protein (TIGR00251 family)